MLDKKRLFAALMTLVMLVSLLPVSVFASDCTHHQTHTADCGYAEAKAGTPCIYVHSEACCTTTVTCTHKHDAVCGYAEATEETEAVSCTHQCSDACAVKETTCTHKHDEVCGYAPAVEAGECKFKCPECSADKDENNEDPDPQVTPVPSCTGDMDCTLTEGHKEDCLKAKADKEAAELAKCDQSDACTAALHKEDCLKAKADKDAAELEKCTEAEGCESTLHKDTCPLYVWACDTTKDCKAADHAEGCVAPLWAEFDRLVAELPAPDTVDPMDDEMLEALHGDIQAIVTYALENGLYTNSDEATCHPVIAAVLDAMQPKETPDAEPVVATIGEVEYTDLLTAFKALAASGGTIELTKDAVIPVTAWESLTISNATIHGNGATITGLTMPLVMNGTSTIAINDLTIKNSAIKGEYTGHSGSDTAGAFVGYVYALQLNNCHLADSSVTSTNYSGGLVGYQSGQTVISNCSVKNCDVVGASSTGGMVGHSNGKIQVSGTVGANTVNSSGGDGWQGVIFGVLTGAAGNTINVTEQSKSSSTSGDLCLIGGRLTDVNYTGGTYLTNPVLEGENEYDEEGVGNAVPPAGYEFSDNGSGTFGFSKLPVVAKIGEKEYTDLLLAFQEVTAGQTIELTKDAEIPVKKWEEVNLSQAVTINGNGATITGLTMPLVMNATGTVVVENLTIQNSEIEGVKSSNSGDIPNGAFFGYAGSTAVLRNCAAENCVIKTSKYAGGLAGYVNTGFTIENCSVTNTKVNGLSAGGMVGHSNGAISVSGTVGGNTISGENAEKEGSVISTLNSNANNTVDVTETSRSTGVKSAADQKSLYVIGRRYENMTYTGGTYWSDPTKCGTGTGTGEPAEGYLIIDNGDGSWSVKKELTVSGLTTVNRTYNGTNVIEITDAQLTGVLEGDDVSIDAIVATTEDGNVGANKAVTVDAVTLRGKDKDKYAPDYAAITGLTVDITRATLTVTYRGETIGHVFSPKLEVEVTGFVNGETAATAAGYKAPTVSHSGSTPGEYLLVPTGGDADNYEFTYVGGKLVIFEYVEYKIITGAKQTIEQNEAALFRSDAAYSKFVEVRVDGAVVDPVNYTTREGSTIVEMKPAYTNTLAIGEHTLTIVSADGSASTVFTVDPPTVLVSFDSNGGTTPSTTQKEVIVGDAYGELPTVTKEGYTFAGWFTAEDVQVTAETVFTKDTALFAKWTVINYTITYHMDGGTNPADAAAAYTVESPVITLPVPTKAMYRFEGWYAESTFNTKVTEVPAGSTGDKAFYAKWTEVIYEITQGAAQTVAMGNDAVFTADADFSKFEDVLVDGKSVDKDNYTVESDSTKLTLKKAYIDTLAEGSHTLTILFSDGKANTTFTVTIPTMVVSFDANGGLTTPKEVTVTYGQAYGKLPTATKEGYTFAGWFTAKTGGTRVYDTTVVTADSAHILYADWNEVPVTEEAQTILVSFDANGGKTPSTTQKEVTIGEAYGKLPTTTKDGLYFAGWYTAKSGGTRVYDTTVVTADSDHILYAHWSEVPVTGDNSAPVLWLGLLAMSLLGLAVIARAKGKKGLYEI